MKRSHLLHPGTILGTLVLVAALSGSVYGASTSGTATVGSSQIKNGSIALADISPKARRALRGVRGPAGPRGAAGPAGSAGAAGPAGTARAFGYVASNGTLDAARSKNLTVVKQQGVSGEYCVTPSAASGVTRSTAFPVVSADFSDGSGTIHLAQFLSIVIAGCENGWLVVTDNFTAGNFVRADIAFSIVVP